MLSNYDEKDPMTKAQIECAMARAVVAAIRGGLTLEAAIAALEAADERVSVLWASGQAAQIDRNRSTAITQGEQLTLPGGMVKEESLCQC